MKRFFTLCVLTQLACSSLRAQCDTTLITGDLVISSDVIMSGYFVVSGNFEVSAGTTVYVESFQNNGCGKLEVHAPQIIISGNINGDYSGYTGGNAGMGGSQVTSITGDIIALDNCSNKDYTGQVTVEGGKAGQVGNGPGAGNPGSNGNNGSGPKQQCQNNNDEAGVIGSAGGAGGGGGGSYGGTGTAGAAGGDGTDYYQASNVNVSTGFVVVMGAGGNGGNAGSVYGTATANDIDAGSGGAGSGGGGRSYDQGMAGNNGGAGGGMVKLVATDTLTVTGNIFVNGENGKNGGNAGNGGTSPKCCSDGCDDCGEVTLSCGAGAGSGSGGGSGGGIYLESFDHVYITGALNAKGGNGGYGGTKGFGSSCSYGGGIFCGSAQTLTTGDGSNGGRGGAGGGGRIKIFSPDCAGSIVTPAYNVNGGTSTATASAGTYNYYCVPLSKEELLKEKYSLLVYPNPARETITVQFKNALLVKAPGNMEIMDLSGQLVMSENCMLHEQTTQQINVSALSAGIYFIRISADGFNSFQKFIKQ